MIMLCSIFVRRKTSKNSPKIAIQLVENIWDGKKIKQKIIRHFDTALNEDEAKILTRLALVYKAQLQEQSEQLKQKLKKSKNPKGAYWVILDIKNF